MIVYFDFIKKDYVPNLKLFFKSLNLNIEMFGLLEYNENKEGWCSRTIEQLVPTCHFSIFPKDNFEIGILVTLKIIKNVKLFPNRFTFEFCEYKWNKEFLKKINNKFYYMSPRSIPILRYGILYFIYDNGNISFISKLIEITKNSKIRS